MDMRQKVVEMLEHAAQIEHSLVSSLTEKERVVSGKFEDWSIKDQIAHCAAWKDRLVRNIKIALEGIVPVRSEDYDRENEEIFYEFKEQSWEEILAYSEQALSELIESINRVSDEDLFVTEVLPWQSGRELWKLILGTGYTHPLTHYSQAQMKREKLQQAREIQEEMSQSLMGLDESPSWQGVAIYNLACFYSLSGEKEKAIKDLKEALHLNPALVDWSKQDPDFDPIRKDPEYLAIYDSL